MLSDLRAAEFIYEQPALTEAEYVFKHALTQEVAYNSLLRERRKQIHERAAQAIKALFALNLSDQYSELARDYAPSDNVSKGRRNKRSKRSGRNGKKPNRKRKMLK